MASLKLTAEHFDFLEDAEDGGYLQKDDGEGGWNPLPAALQELSDHGYVEGEQEYEFGVGGRREHYRYFPSPKGKRALRKLREGRSGRE